jgi:hypothetical protein
MDYNKIDIPRARINAPGPSWELYLGLTVVAAFDKKQSQTGVWRRIWPRADFQRMRCKCKIAGRPRIGS